MKKSFFILIASIFFINVQLSYAAAEAQNVDAKAWLEEKFKSLGEEVESEKFSEFLAKIDSFVKKTDDVVEKDDKRSSFKGRKKFKKRQRPKKFSFKKHKKK